MKTKYLTRSHAMREVTSPPRTPTPRSERNYDYNGTIGKDSGITDSIMHLQSSPTKIIDSGGSAPSVVITSQANSCQAKESIVNNGSVICEADFPKLTPPKSSKTPRHINMTSIITKEQQLQSSNCQDLIGSRNDSANTSHKNDVALSLQNINAAKRLNDSKINGSDYIQIITNDISPRNDDQNLFTPDESQNDIGGRGSSSSSTHSSSGPKKIHKINGPSPVSTSKGSKPRLKNLGSTSICEEINSKSNSTSGFISRDSSTEQFTDSNGVDLIGFFKETLNKNSKDRNTLLQIEEDLIDLVDEKSRREIRFPAASSYHRMLIHRTAAFFIMDHNVDTETQTCVIVTKTRNTRIPDIRFNTLCRETFNDDQPPRKSILKRDAHSFDDPRQGLLCPERIMLDRKTKSFEEREEEYEKARTRIFRNRDSDESYWSWHLEKSDQISRLRQNKMLKMKPTLADNRDQRPSVSKANSFGGYGVPSSSNTTSLQRGNSMNMSKGAGSRYITKQDSICSNTPWRMSPSSSGYKTQTQSLRSGSATPSPSGSGSCDDNITPEPPSSPQPKSSGIMWAVSDMASIPKGSVLIDPQTLQPVINTDGSIYHYDPSNLPPSKVLAPGMYNTTNNKNKLQAKKFTGNNSSCNNNLNNSMNSLKMISSTTSTSATEDSDKNVSRSDDAATISSDTVDSSENKKCNSIFNNEVEDKDEDDSDIEKIPDKMACELYCGEIKPLVRNQSTSPKIPIPDSEDKLQEGCDILSESKTSTPASLSHVQQDSYKDEEQNNYQSVVKSSNIPIMNFAPSASYQIEGTTVYSQTGTQANGHYLSAYQQGADGNLYAIPSSSLVYAYPQPLDGEIQGYFMSVYDPSAATQPSVNSGQPTIYQSGAPTVVPVAAYAPTPFPGTQFYQGSIIYSTEQYPNSVSLTGGSQTSSASVSQPINAVTSSGQISQYPLTASYPIGYTYPTNGYWGQPMTYYVPQQTLTNPSGVLAHTTHAHSSNADSHKTTIPSNSVGGIIFNNKKRSTPPNNNNLSSQLLQSNQLQTSNSSTTSVTANTTYQFASAVPLTLASSADFNGQPVYAAIPAQHSFSANILPLVPSSTSSQTSPTSTTLSTSTSALVTPATHTNSTQIPRNSSPSSQTVINSLVPTSSSSTSSLTTSSSTTSSYKNMQLASTASLSSTNSSTSYLTNRSNPPLFQTPPIFVAASSGYHQHHYYDVSVDKRCSHANKRNSGGYIPSGRQHSFASTVPQSSTHLLRKQSSFDSSSAMSNYRFNQQAKRLPLSSNSTGIISHATSESKPRAINNGGNQRLQKPATLDFKKNGYSYSGQSQRNSPSNNSGESGSPNSFVSSVNGSTVTSTTSQFVAPGTYVATEYHIASGGHQSSSHQNPATFYMTTSTRSAHIPSTTVHHAPNSASVVTNEIANAACHQHFIGTYPHNPGHHPHSGTGMYFKYSQPYFAPNMALPNNRRSPPSDMRPPMTSLTGVFPAMNMMIQAPRQLQPRHPNPNYKGNKTR